MKPTLCRIFKHIDDEAMSERMSEFTSAFHDELVGFAGDILCIDGKAMRGTVLENGRNPDIVSAYSLKGGVTLATDMCEEKGNEITSVPRLLDKVDVSGCIVTADAMSFQKAIIDFRAQTVGQGGCVRMHSYGRRHVLPESHHRRTMSNLQSLWMYIRKAPSLNMAG